MSVANDKKQSAKSAAVRVPEDIHKVLRVEAAHTGEDMQTIVDRILRPALKPKAAEHGIDLNLKAA